jgi:hypothetical protein
MNLEYELKQALRRREPPAGFTERVMAAVERDGAVTPRRRPWHALAAAALFAAIVGGAATVRVIEERREGERAKEEVMTALRIAGAKLHDARVHVREISER